MWSENEEGEAFNDKWGRVMSQVVRRDGAHVPTGCLDVRE
jgi:hypothetical protein